MIDVDLAIQHSGLTHVLSLLADTTIRGTILLLMAVIILRVCIRASATYRHLIWVIACGGMLLMPLAVSMLPTFQVPVRREIVAPLQRFVDQPRVLQLDRSPTMPAAPNIETQRGQNVGWIWVVLGLWGGLGVIILAMLLESQRRIRQLVSEATPITDAGMSAVLENARRTMGISELVAVKVHSSTIPMVCGVFHPIIVLPVSAREWSNDRLYNVLLHELAHIKRYDCATRTVASFLCALYWFNPVVWFAVRRLQIEQERACDDAVLRAGSHANAYASDILELTQTFRPERMIALAALPFARVSQLEMRLESIVDRARRRSLVSRWGLLSAYATGFGIVYPLAGLTPRPSDSRVRVEMPVVHEVRQNAITPAPEIQSMKNGEKALLASAISAGALMAIPTASQAQDTTPVVTKTAPILKVKATVRLIIVDGVRRLAGSPFPTDIDIHSMQVMKGPKVVALYGPEAANGVIIITTKAYPKP